MLHSNFDMNLVATYPEREGEQVSDVNSLSAITVVYLTTNSPFPQSRQVSVISRGLGLNCRQIHVKDEPSQVILQEDPQRPRKVIVPKTKSFCLVICCSGNGSCSKQIN